MVEEYFLSEDNDSHWYVVPIKKQQEWNEWANLESSDERAWHPPKWAKAVGGSPSLIVFREYRSL